MVEQIKIQTPTNQSEEIPVHVMSGAEGLPPAVDEAFQQNKMNSFMAGRHDVNLHITDPNYNRSTKWERRTDAVLDMTGRAPATRVALARIATAVGQANERLLSPKFANQEFKDRERERVRLGL